jgi:hypothetical protein
MARLKSEFENADKVAANPSTVTLLLRLPDDTEVELTPLVNPVVGEYYYDYLIGNLPGIYSYRFVGTGLVAQSGEKRFQVRSTAFDAPV